MMQPLSNRYSSAIWREQRNELWMDKNRQEVCNVLRMEQQLASRVSVLPVLREDY